MANKTKETGSTADPTIKKRSRKLPLDNHYLRCVTDFMTRYSLSTMDLSRATGKNRMTYTQMLNRDDARLSTVLNIFRAFGCKLIIVAEHEDDLLDVQVPNIVIEGRPKQDRALEFVYQELTRKGWYISDLARAMDDSKYVLINKLSNDNCTMKYIYRMADALGVRLRFRLVPIPKEENQDAKETATIPATR